MTLRQRLAGLIIATAAFGLTAVASANEGDKREISSYVLTEAGLGKFAQATQNLAAIPGACVREDEDDDGNGNESIDQMAAKLDSLPGAKAAVQSAGMTSREYVIFMFSMMEAGLSSWAMSQGGKLPPGVSQANVDFYKKHETAMAEIGKNEGCGGKDEDDDGDE